MMDLHAWQSGSHFPDEPGASPLGTITAELFLNPAVAKNLGHHFAKAAGVQSGFPFLAPVSSQFTPD
jgi:hypothetical protein